MISSRKKEGNVKRAIYSCIALIMLLLPACSAAPATVTASGDITAAVEEYRQLLGGANHGGDPGTHAEDGYREINWDSVPDESAAPNFYVSDFFNAPEAPRARGIVLTTDGDGLMISADSDNPTNTLPRFGNVNEEYV